ncbi:MAG: hypothetical protein SynsKO_34860 [Synoicihabitans sp.]
MDFVENVEGTETAISYSGDWVTFSSTGTFSGTYGGLGDNTFISQNSTYAEAMTAIDFPVFPFEGGFGGGSVSGDSFGFLRGKGAGGTYWAPVGYTVGDTISGVMVITESLTELGFDPGEIVSGGSFDIGGTTITWTASTASAVPEPSSFAIIVGTLALGFASTRRRRHRAELPIG